MLNQVNAPVQQAAKKQPRAGDFFHRLADNTRLVFRGRAGLEAEAGTRVIDANSLIGKSDDYETGRKLYSRAIKLLNMAKLKSANPSGVTLGLLAEAYLGLAICKWVDGENDVPELKKAIEHANAALEIDGLDKNAESTLKHAARRLKG